MPPTNDDLANARVITADVSYNDTTVGATNEAGTEASDYDDVGVWYRLEFPSTGKWRIRVTNASYVGPFPSYDIDKVSYGSLIYGVTTDPPASIDDLNFSYFYQHPQSQQNTASDDIAQTPEYAAGSVLYLRLGSRQTSSFPYTQWTGTYTISFEFVTAPYNPGSPPANSDMSTAEVLDVTSGPVAGTTIGAPNDSVWYRWEPVEDCVLTVTIETNDPDWKPYGDMYHLDGANDPPVDYGDLSNDGWYQWLGDRDYLADAQPRNPGFASFSLTGGEVYLMEVYDFYFIFNADFTITSQINRAPANDRIDNAQVISPSLNWPEVISGTTVYGSQDYDEVINWDGSMTPSVWYVLDNQGPGAMSLAIKSLTDGWNVQFETYYKDADHTAMGVTGMDQLDQDGSRTTKDTHRGYDVVTNYAMYYGLEGGGSGAYDWDPLVGGEKFYIRVTGYNDDGQYDAGQFELTAFVAPPAVCLDAIDYINPDSTTASIVSGNVREVQYIPQDQGGVSPYTPKHWSGWMDEQVATLIIPGEDIADGPGLYSVTIKYKNASDAYNWVAGFRRNGQPLEPGAEMNVAPDSTEWMTMQAGAPRPSELDMLPYLPVQPGDEIQVVVSANDYHGVGSNYMDVWQVCFQKMLEATPAPAYKQLDIPNYPLGTSSSDMGTNDQQGDLMIYKDVAPTYASHRSTNADLCVTDDGTLWCLASWSCDGFSGNRIGPVLQKWNGSSWDIVNDDIGGFGVKRAYGNPSSVNGWSLSMDTDGTDIWVCYGVLLGAIGPTGTTSYSVGIQVRKYDVGGNSWSDVGSPFYGSRANKGGSSGNNYDYTPAEAGDWGETPIIRVSPGGVPWVAFTDAYCPDAGSDDDFAFWSIRTYVARWTGSTWSVHVLPGPYEADDSYTFHQVASSGATTYNGMSCDEVTQTSPASDTISFTPPAGKWCFMYRSAWDYVSGSIGWGVRWYKNGVLVGGNNQSTPGSVGTALSDQNWHSSSFYEGYVDCNGSDVISVRLWKEGTGTGHLYIAYAGYIDAHRVEENTGFGFNTRFVDDGQPQTVLYMHQVGDVGKGENPGVLYYTSYTRPFLSLDERDAATPPQRWDSMADLNHASDGNTTRNSMVLPAETSGDYLWNWQTWIYAEWNGSEWVKKWNELIEEHAPNHVYVQTVYDAIASTPPVGHYQQGLGGDTDGQYNYMTANLGGGQAFGFFGDTIVALRIGADGFEPFTDGPPGALQGPGYPQGTIFGLAGFSGWGWDTGGRSIHVDTNGNVWLAWEGTEGATFNYSDFIASAAMGGMTPDARGLSGWYAAGDTNESLGYDNTYMPVGHVVSSPNGDTVYVLFDAFIWSDATAPVEPYTFGVYECPVIDGHIPLIPLFLVSGPISLHWREAQRADVWRVS